MAAQRTGQNFWAVSGLTQVSYACSSDSLVGKEPLLCHILEEFNISLNAATALVSSDIFMRTLAISFTCVRQNSSMIAKEHNYTSLLHRQFYPTPNSRERLGEEGGRKKLCLSLPSRQSLPAGLSTQEAVTRFSLVFNKTMIDTIIIFSFLSKEYLLSF